MNGLRRLGTLTGIAVTAVLVLSGAAQSSAADEGYDELAEFPGLGIPDSRVTGEWLTPQQRGVTYLERARQWTRTPTLQSVAFNRSTQQWVDSTCSRITQARGARRFREWWADVTLVDRGTALNSPRRYGYTQSFVVRTVAFGSVPVEATVALEQPRTAKGVVIPATLKQGVAQYCASQGGFEIPPPHDGWRYLPAEGDGSLRVRIDEVAVDGVVLPLAGCAADGATLRLTSRDYLKWDPRIPDDERPESQAGNTKAAILRTPYYVIERGGLLFGSLDIPAFAGCATADGDDLSALLTASVSGPGNTVQLRTEALAIDVPTGGQETFATCPFGRDCADRFPAPALPTEPPS
ncbi:hypothetical protein [Mumia sp. DW29H23]|uniref:hypothetical protein n=1 Tax=Mumia sp. DW29H23 TaxID=3421241 RepID=UPI003D69D50C